MAYGSSWYNASSGSQIKYTPGTRYTLIDFLPSQMQALSGKHFAQQTSVFSLPFFVKGQESKQMNQTCLFLINCWGFAYNMLYYSRLPPEQSNVNTLFFSVSAPTIAYDAFWDLKYFDKIQSSIDNPALLTDKYVRNTALIPGDVILIWHKNQKGVPYLDHIAIFIDDDLYYEKSGTGNDVPFRLNDFIGLSSAWPINIGVFFVDWRRMKPSVILPDPAQRFGLNNSDTVNEINNVWINQLKTQVQNDFAISASFNDNGDIDAQTYTWIKALEQPFLVDVNGRSYLPEQYYDPAFFAISIPSDIYN
jgi:hypothetical protein